MGFLTSKKSVFRMCESLFMCLSGWHVFKVVKVLQQ